MTRPISSVLKTLALVGLFGASLACGYWDAYRRTKQIRTYAYLQAIVSFVDEHRSRNLGQLETATIEDAISRAAPGRKDSWGNDFAFAIRATEAGQSYIVLSYGSDGKPDVASIEEYFSRPREVVAGQWTRDIVFRDGEPILTAGK